MKRILVCLALLTLNFAFAQKKKPAAAPSNEPLKTAALQGLQDSYGQYKDIALQIWNNAELGYKEVKSSALLQETLRKEGFTVEAGVADIPTAFVATYGSGQPVIGILAEFDALPGLAQQAVPEKKGIAGQAGGHGCGHHLFGAASVAAVWQPARPRATIERTGMTLRPTANVQRQTASSRGTQLLLLIWLLLLLLIDWYCFD
jgi:aminobenzoyl-glutamate utilization protein B